MIGVGISLLQRAIIGKPAVPVADNVYLTNPGDLTHVDWTKSSTSIGTGIDDPDGGSAAFSVTADAGYGLLFQAFTGLASEQELELSAYVRRDTGTGTIYFYDADYTGFTALALTTSWQRFIITSTCKADGSAQFRFMLQTIGDVIDIYDPRMS